MRNARKLIATLALVLALVQFPPGLASADTYYVPPNYVTAYENSYQLSQPVVANTANTYPPYLQSVIIEWAGIASGDSVSLIFYDTSLQQMSEVSVTSSGQSISAPANAWEVKISLRTGSAPGKRYVWFSQVTNTFGNVAVFQPPDTSDAGGGTAPGPYPAVPT